VVSRKIRGSNFVSQYDLKVAKTYSAFFIKREMYSTSKEINIECTINLHKRLHGVKFKNRASRAVFEIKKFAKNLLNSNEIRVDSKLNKEIWKYGPRHVPFRVRIRISKIKSTSLNNLNNGLVFICLVKKNRFKKLETQNNIK
jgi:large subunit ribosomal protein L31e